MRRPPSVFVRPFRTLRQRLIATSLIVVAVPLAGVAATLLFHERAALLQEKEKRLFALTRILDAQLGPGGFDALLADRPATARGRDDDIRALSRRLGPITEQIAQADPGAGVGYYSRALDAIVTYGPAADYGHTVGRAIAPDHPGRAVMETGAPRIESGVLVRGPILNAMLPLKRDGAVIGYAWANETTQAIGVQQRLIVAAVAATSLLGLIGAFFILMRLSRRLSQEVRLIVDGLERMKSDLRSPLPDLRDELGVIVRAVNDMAKALLDARSLNENILASVADGIVSVDRRGVVTVINPAAETFYGVRAAQAIGRPYRDIFPHDPARSALLDTLATGVAHRGVVLDLGRGDQTRRAEVTSSLLRDADDKEIGAVMLLKDVSDRDRLMVQVMRADRLAALGELTAGIAHEIRNPLTSIRGFLQYLQEAESADEWRAYAPIIIAQVDSLNHIVGELLAFGRSRPPLIEDVRLGDIADEMVFLMQGKAKGAIEVRVAPDTPCVEGDREALRQALLNLLINASHATSEHGEISVAIAPEGEDHVLIAVRDTGVGISEANLARVFDPFFSTKPAGTGLGLAVVHRIVDSHSGQIAIRSRPGEGATVEIRLPVKHARAESET